MDEYKDLFDSKLGKYTGEKIELKVKRGTKTIFMKSRAVPFAFTETLEIEINRLLKEGVIERVDNSEWGIPILKSDGGIRVCADYKITVNKYIEYFKYPLPRIEEIFTALQGGEQFTKLDLSNAYNQLEVTDDTELLLAWSTHKGIYVMNRLPFGTEPACAIFQRTIEKVLQGCKGVKNF